MEKVWDELKKIEAQAEQIQADAKDKAKKMTQQAKQDADKLIANSKTYGDEESQKLYTNAVSAANQERVSQLAETEQASKHLKAQAEKRMDKSVSTVVDAVLEEE